MKSSLFLIFLTCSITHLFASNTSITPPDSSARLIERAEAIRYIEQGKQLVSTGKMRDALILFRQAALKDKFSWKTDYWIAYCHLRLNNFGYAKQYSLSSISKDKQDVDPEIYYILGKSFHQLGKLDSAIWAYNSAMGSLSKSRLKEMNVEKELENCYFAETEMEKSANKRISLRGEVNSGYNDYNPILTNNGNRLYFTSRRPNTTGGKMNPEDQEYFEDIYRADWNNVTQQWDSITNKIDRINGIGFDAITSISPDGLRALTTLNTSIVDVKKQTQSSDICEMEFTKKGKWTPPKVIENKSINSSFYDGSATMTADGNTMYFVSDRRAEKSMTDIYEVKKVGKIWGEAVLVSDSINTNGRETTPYITPDGRFLFFSSDGHQSMGGYDVYVSENLGNTWSKPINLGAGVNSVNDDTHFKVYKTLNKAVLASFTIKGLKSSIDMFEIPLNFIQLPVTLK